jgi:hypothetical protein
VATLDEHERRVSSRRRRGLERAALAAASWLALGGGCGAAANPGGRGEGGAGGMGHESGAGGESSMASGGAAGLTWQDPPAAEMGRNEARTYCEELTLDGHDDWRLPTISELRALVAGCPASMPGGACNLVHENGTSSAPPYAACEGCARGAGPGPGGCYWLGRSGPCGTYWSTTGLYHFDLEGHALDFATASMMTLGWATSVPFHVRCVRGP